MKKAKRNLSAAQKLAQELPDIAIYHCQQAAEKALKAFLILYDLEPTDTHNINTLVKLASNVKPDLATVLKEAGYLSQYNLTYRYPSEASDDFNPSKNNLYYCTGALAYATSKRIINFLLVRILRQQYRPAPLVWEDELENRRLLQLFYLRLLHMLLRR